LLEDSLLNIRWKITNDTRRIAGFECRKAVGILFDTVAVFAFYTDELTISGGPEGIHGLPGMILGMGIPRLHTTWFATKVQVVDVNTKTLAPAAKGEKVNRKTMFEAMDKVLSDWEYGKKMILATLI
jgi:GLPGLI family protein